MSENNNCLTLEASLKSLNAVHDFILKKAAKAGLSRKKINNLLLAVEEVYVNITNYAYPNDKGKVSIYFSMDEKNVTLHIKDEGVPFNPLQAPEPDLASSLKERRVGGLGIFLVRKLINDVRYERDKQYNVLTLTLCREKVERDE
ncbi:ATP-binding protein [Candidatus Aerophobetes bacterium]|nr:ATP-binding protein [Candidatus Aerophobetes bacterium]